MWYSAVGCIVTFTLSLLVVPLLAVAQPVGKVRRIGMLIPGSSSAFAPRIEAFRHGLRDLGYVEGRNITMEYRFAEGKDDRLPELVAELIRLQVDVMVIDGNLAIGAAQHATTTIPIGVCLSKGGRPGDDITIR